MLKAKTESLVTIMAVAAFIILTIYLLIQDSTSVGPL
jgi:hypothetical protein